MHSEDPLRCAVSDTPPRAVYDGMSAGRSVRREHRRGSEPSSRVRNDHRPRPGRKDVRCPAPHVDLQERLDVCVTSAREALSAAEAWRTRLHDVLQRYNRRVERVRLPRTRATDPELDELQREFARRVAELTGDLQAMGEAFGADLDESFERLQGSADFVTVALFGRTKAGKSTTMEALTHGDGTTIGKGAQHTTRDVEAYYWPPEQRTLRVVDTPGIEGYRGEELAEMAQRYVERADMVLFLISDDRASAEELDRFGRIRTFGKAVTVLLNVKEADLDMLVDVPEYVYEPSAIDGHRHRIAGYLEDHFQLPNPEVIPVHALAAWQSTTTEADEAAVLRARSRIDAVEQRLERFVRYEARAARLRSPRDLLFSHIVSTKDQLRPCAGIFRALYDSTRERKEAMRTKASGVIADGHRSALGVFDIFEQAEAELPGLVDTLIASGKHGRALDRAWHAFLEQHELDQVGECFRKTVLSRLSEELSAEIASARFDSQHGFRPDGVSDLFAETQDHGKYDAAKRYARAGLQTAGGAVAAGLATWAVTNFWNPSGWAAGLAALAAGYIGRQGAKAATDHWKSVDRKNLARQRDAIVRSLELRLQAYARAAVDGCTDFLQELASQVNAYLEGRLGYVETGAQEIWQASVRTLHDLDDAAAALNRDWLTQCAQIAREETGASVKVVDAVYDDRMGAKLLVRINGDGLAASAWASLIESVVAGPVALVDADASPAEQVAAALGPAQIAPKRVRLVRDAPRRGRRRTPQVNVLADAAQAKLAIGPNGANARAAGRLLKVRIRVIGAREQERVS